MPRKYPEIELKKKLRLIAKAGIKEGLKTKDDFEELPDLNERIKKILSLNDEYKKNKNVMTFFVMYDISNDKVRNEVAKYLKRKGCIRIQKSIFMATLPHKVYAEIHQTLREVQESYENQDSIIFVPISSDEVKAMKIIGKSVDIDLILGSNNTLFF